MVNRSIPQAIVKPSLFPSPLYVTSQRHVPSALATNVVFVVEYVALPLTFTACSRAGVPAQVASLGENSLNVIEPSAFAVAPLSVAESLGIRLCAVVPPGVFLLTTRISLVHTLVADVLLASPEYTAWQ